MMLIHKLRIVALATALGWGCATGPSEPTEPAPAEPTPVDQGLVALNRILVLENRRADPQDELGAYALDVELEVRMAAVRALGRFPYPEHKQGVTRSLITALADSSPEVRGLAAFGLGLRADPASAPDLKRFMANWDGEDPQVCALVVEAAGRFEDKALRKEVMYATDHPSPLVRIKAARAAWDWNTSDPDAAVVDNRLANLASRAPVAMLMDRWQLDEASAQKMQKEQLEVVWSALFSLSRRGSELGRDVYYLWCRAESSVEARIFATRGLAKLKQPRKEELEALRECLNDGNWQVAVAAANGLLNSKAGASRVALEQVLATHENLHVKLACIDALGTAARDDKLMIESTLGRYLRNSDPALTAHALVALAQLGGDEFLPTLKNEDYLKHRSPIVRKAVAQSCQYLSPELAAALLDLLIEDGDPYVAYNAAVAYGQTLDQGGRSRARLLLAHADNGIRLGATLALKEGPNNEDLSYLEACYDGSVGENSDEIKMEILDIAGGLPPNAEAQRILRKGLTSNRPYIQELAHGFLVKNYGRPGNSPLAYSPRKGTVPTLERRSTNPRVRISTESGDMTFELFPAQAPVHVHNFMTLARSGHYDGLSIHRVVSGFVVQGGDHRGDGNGGLSWREDHEPLRAEYSELPYLRGSLGMPRNADPDSAGSQWFVTQMATPHLDGRYTLFGMLNLEDGRTLDKIMEGTRIRRVTVLGE